MIILGFRYVSMYYFKIKNKNMFGGSHKLFCTVFATHQPCSRHIIMPGNINLSPIEPVKGEGRDSWERVMVSSAPELLFHCPASGTSRHCPVMPVAARAVQPPSFIGDLSLRMSLISPLKRWTIEFSRVVRNNLSSFQNQNCPDIIV